MTEKIDFAFSFKGTITRKKFAIAFIVIFLLEALTMATIVSTKAYILWALVFVLVWSQLAVCVKRLRDSGHTWKWILVVLGIACICSALSASYQRQANIAYVETMVRMKDAKPQQIRAVVEPLNNLAAVYRAASEGTWLIFFLVMVALPSKNAIAKTNSQSSSAPVDEVKTQAELDRDYYNQTIFAYETLKKNYPDYKEEFDLLEPHVKEALKDVEASRYEYETKKTHPITLALLLTTNAIADELPYGRYFMYRGCLNMKGELLYKLFLLAVDKLEEVGYHSHEKANEERAWIKEAIASNG